MNLNQKSIVAVTLLLMVLTGACRTGQTSEVEPSSKGGTEVTAAAEASQASGRRESYVRKLSRHTAQQEHSELQQFFTKSEWPGWSELSTREKTWLLGGDLDVPRLLSTTDLVAGMLEQEGLSQGDYRETRTWRKLGEANTQRKRADEFRQRFNNPFTDGLSRSDAENFSPGDFYIQLVDDPALVRAFAEAEVADSEAFAEQIEMLYFLRAYGENGVIWEGFRAWWKTPQGRDFGLKKRLRKARDSS